MRMRRTRYSISIHAPPRGATSCAGGCSSRCDISIHAPPRGATEKATIAQLDNKFQFTPLREGRRAAQSSPSPSIHFNSRPSARGDFLNKGIAPDYDNFNSRPSARGDALYGYNVFYQPTFQFTPLREGRHHAQEWIKSTINFNSRPSARGDVIGNSGGWLHIEFQFTPLREGRPDYQVAGEGLDTFQFTPLREGRPKE